jgi:hypothetical protein
VEQKCEYKDGGKNRSGVGAGPYHPTFGRRVIFQMPSSRSPFLEQETSEASPQTDKHVVTCIGRRIAPVACVELGREILCVLLGHRFAVLLLIAY